MVCIWIMTIEKKNEMSVMHDDLCKEKREGIPVLSEIESSTDRDELTAEELDELMNKHMEIYPQELEESFCHGI